MDLKTAYTITQPDLERITGGLAIEDFVESIDQILLVILLNAHKLDMKAIKEHTWSLHMLKQLLLEMETNAQKGGKPQP